MTAREAMASVAQLPVAVLDGGLERVKRFLSDVNSTNLTIVTGMLVGIVTCGVYLTAFLLELAINEVAFGMWLGFVASWIGFGVRQFRVKRETHAELGLQVRRSSGQQAAL